MAPLVLIGIPTVYDLITPDDVIIVSSQKFGYLKDKHETLYIITHLTEDMFQIMNTYLIQSQLLRNKVLAVEI